jgi:hypothetical protein
LASIRLYFSNPAKPKYNKAPPQIDKKPNTIFQLEPQGRIDAGRWIKIRNFAYLLRFIGIRQPNNQHQIRLKQTRYLPMMDRLSGHQN